MARARLCEHRDRPPRVARLLAGREARLLAEDRRKAARGADGYTVVVPPNPLQGLAYDPAYLADFLNSISGPIVLVGHSYGGAVITNAATGDKQVKALVYVDAFAPDQGQTIGQLVSSARVILEAVRATG